MGQSKLRGTFEQRKLEAETRKTKERVAYSEIQRRRPTRKQMEIRAALAAFMVLGNT